MCPQNSKPNNQRTAKDNGSRSPLADLWCAMESEGVETSELGLPYQRIAGTLENALKAAEGVGKEADIKVLAWEYALFDAVVCGMEHRSDHPYCVVPRYPFGADSEAVPREALEHFRQRLKVSRNPLLRGRYAHILWDRRKESGLPGRESAGYAMISCKEYTEAARRAAKVQKARLTAEYFHDRALGIALELGNRDSLKQALDGALQTLRDWVGSRQRKHVCTLAVAITHIRESAQGKRVVENTVLEEVAGLLESATEPCDSFNDVFEVRPICGVLTKTYFLLGRTEDAHEAKSREAETWVKQADFHGNSYDHVAGCLENAIKLLLEANRKEEAADLKRRMREVNRTAASQGQHRGVPVQVTADKKEVDEAVSSYLKHQNLHDCLRSLALDDARIPSAEAARDAARQYLSSSPIFGLLRHSVVSGDRKAAELKSLEDKTALFTNQLLSQATFKQLTFYITSTLARLVEEKALNAASLNGYLKDLGQMTNGILELTAVGFERYFAQDFTSAVYILVPALERAIRELLLQSLVDVTPARRGGFRNKNLGKILEMKEVKQQLGPEVRDFLYFVLVDEEHAGINLRNKVAHGEWEAGSCGQAIADLVVFLYLVLTRYVPGDKGTQYEGDKGTQSMSKN